MVFDRDFDHRAETFDADRFEALFADMVNDCAELIEIIHGYRIGAYSKAEMAELIADKVEQLKDQAHDAYAEGGAE